MRAQPLLTVYEGYKREKYESMGLAVAKVFYFEHDADAYRERVRPTVLAAATALRGRVAFFELDDIGGYDMKEYGLGNYQRPSIGLMLDFATWTSNKRAQAPPAAARVLAAAARAYTVAAVRRYAYESPTGSLLVEPGSEADVVAWAERVMAGEVEPDQISNPARTHRTLHATVGAADSRAGAGGQVPEPHDDVVQHLVGRNFRKRVLGEAPHALVLTYTETTAKKELRRARAELTRVGAALRAVAPGVVFFGQMATNDNHVHVRPPPRRRTRLPLTPRLHFTVAWQPLAAVARPRTLRCMHASIPPPHL